MKATGYGLIFGAFLILCLVDCSGSSSTTSSGTLLTTSSGSGTTTTATTTTTTGTCAVSSSSVSGNQVSLTINASGGTPGYTITGLTLSGQNAGLVSGSATFSGTVTDVLSFTSVTAGASGTISIQDSLGVSFSCNYTLASSSAVGTTSSSSLTTVALGTVYGPLSNDGFVVVSGRMDGVAGLLRVSVNADRTAAPSVERAWGYAGNNGSTYVGSLQLTVPVRAGEYFQILCNGLSACPTGYIGLPQMYFFARPVFSTASPAPTTLSLGQIYGPVSTDGYLVASGRLDGASGLAMLSVSAGYGSPSVPIQWAYSYNTGSTYYGSFQLMAPVRSGQYVQVLCNGGTACGGSEFVGGANFSFVPVSTTSGIGAPVTVSQGIAYGPIGVDGLIITSGRTDNAVGISSMAVYTAPSLSSSPFLAGYDYSYNNGSTYLGSFQLKIPVIGGQYFEVACDDQVNCNGGRVVGSEALLFFPLY